jgi:formamidase
MPRTHSIRIDRTKSLQAEPETGHNRWHPDIPPILTVEPGEVVVMETRDALDGVITARTQAADLLNLNLGRIHPLTGPIYVDGAEPGDLVAVRILEVQPQAFGFTFITPGFGFCGNTSPTRSLRAGKSRTA